MNNRCPNPACGKEQPDRKRVFCNRQCQYEFYVWWETRPKATNEERERFRPALAEAFGFNREE
jgi:hypothetical protein